VSTNPLEPFIARLRPCTDDELLATLAALPPLADDKHQCWMDESYWNDIAYPYLACAELAGERRLRAAIPLVLARAAYGDAFGTMAGLRHSAERAFSLDLRALADVCLAAIDTGRPGTVLWAVHQLLVIADPRSRPVLQLWARSTDAEIAWVAQSAVDKIDRGLR
jgi:hypothetical protein